MPGGRDRRGGAGVDAQRLLSVVLWLLAWQLASRLVGSHLLLAGPWETLVCLVRLLGSAGFWKAVAFSLVRIVVGFVSALVIALVLAPLARRSRMVAELVSVGLGAVKSVPVVCVVVLLLMLVGSRNVSAVAVLLVALPALYFSAYEALGSLDAGMGEMLAACGVGGMRRILGHVWPSLQPFMVATCKNVIGMSWKAGVAAELIGMPLGSIGERIYQTKLLLETGELFAWTIAVVVLAGICERSFLALLAASVRSSLRVATRCRPDSREVPATPPTCVSLRDVSVIFDDGEVLANVDLSLGAGGRVCLVDPSGTGKTTLLRLLAGVLAQSSGEVEVIPHGPGTISLMAQSPCLLESVDAVGNVALMAGEWMDEASIRELLLEVLGPDELDRPVCELSGGQRRRVELVRAMARPSGMVLLDEPFASLDAASVTACADFVVRHLRGRTLVVASHLEGSAALLGAHGCTICDLASA